MPQIDTNRCWYVLGLSRGPVVWYSWQTFWKYEWIFHNLADRDQAQEAVASGYMLYHMHSRVFICLFPLKCQCKVNWGLGFLFFRECRVQEKRKKKREANCVSLFGIFFVFGLQIFKRKTLCVLLVCRKFEELIHVLDIKSRRAHPWLRQVNLILTFQAPGGFLHAAMDFIWIIKKLQKVKRG